ncbi:MAG: hypothetical protein KME57_33930 [Scytonema hyalinum WJT4-NPBG1]|nr:hypothetical protein [Scytonema hyalinum WJT4-NPBG1]
MQPPILYVSHVSALLSSVHDRVSVYIWRQALCEDRTEETRSIGKLPIGTRLVLLPASHLGGSSHGQVRQDF